MNRGIVQRARLAAALVGILSLASLAVAVGGGRTERLRASMRGGLTVDGTNAFLGAATGVPAATGLECVAALPEASYGYQSCGRDESGVPVLAAGHRVGGLEGEKDVATRLYRATGETLAAYKDGWLIAPSNDGEGDAGCILWRPEYAYVRASPRRRGDWRYLLARNYAHKPRIMHPLPFEESLRSALAGDSLSFRSVLVRASLTGLEDTLALLDPRYAVNEGFAFSCGGRELLIVTCVGGYQGADTYYTLTNQTVLGASSRLQLRRTEDIAGNYSGLIGIDAESGRTLWKARTGPSPNRVMCCNVNEDPDEEYVVQFYSAENGISGNGTTDAGVSYAMCLDRFGHVLWKSRLVGVHTGVYCSVCDMTGDGENELAICTASPRFERLGAARVFSGWGETLAQRSDLGGLYGIVAADFDDDGRAELVSGGPDSTLYILNHSLEIERECRDPVALPRRSGATAGRGGSPAYASEWCRRLLPLGALDVDGDGGMEILAMSEGYRYVQWTAYDLDSFYTDETHLAFFGPDLRHEGRTTLTAAPFGSGAEIRDRPASLKSHLLVEDVDADGLDEVLVKCRHLFVFDAPVAGGAGETDGRDDG
ncbi:MAG: hypothetical protein GF400_01595 [Candidatus Eisenbacteria bacterium]|nr:hypothetical protein [Candidatus Eisenbacteria bacterium]